MKETIGDITMRAESGDSFAQLLLGYLHENGLGAAIDEQAARSWYELAAKNGCLPAQYALAKLLQRMKDPEWIAWLRKVAEAGYAPAENALATAFEHGMDFEQDKERAIHWRKLSADQGYLPAVESLARMYDLGIGVAPDAVLAEKCLRQAVSKGSMPAAYVLGNMLLERDGGTRAAEGLRWIRQAAKRGNVHALFSLGQLYMSGTHGVPHDPDLAKLFFGLAEQCSGKVRGPQKD